MRLRVLLASEPAGTNLIGLCVAGVSLILLRVGAVGVCSCCSPALLLVLLVLLVGVGLGVCVVAVLALVSALCACLCLPRGSSG